LAVAWKKVLNRGKLQADAELVLRSPFSSMAPRCGDQIIDDVRVADKAATKRSRLEDCLFPAHPGRRISAALEHTMAAKGKQSRTKSAYSLPVIRPYAAGVDIGSQQIHVAVSADRDPEPVRTFGTFTRDLVAIADWLTSVGIQSVAMESTGVYWIPLYQYLESRGFEVALVNATQVKNVPGRKTDVADAAWIQLLHAVGLLRSSFRPSEQVCAIRALVRHRQSLVEAASQCILHLQKALTQMNLQLHNVISDITGATGMRILHAIVDGERNGDRLAELCDRGIHAPREVIVKSLEGDYRREFLFILRQTLEQYEDLQKRIGACEQETARLVDELPAKIEPAEHPLPPPRTRIKRKASMPPPVADLREKHYRILGVDLTAVPCVNTGTVEVLLAEVGPDLSAFPNASNFANWTALPPNNRVTGGKRISARTRKVKSRFATALRMAAQSAAHDESAIGDFYRRMRARLGPEKAITATAHKLARILYHMITTREPYDESVFAKAHEKLRLHQEAKLRASAQKLGFRLVPASDNGVVS
jgi:transposase